MRADSIRAREPKTVTHYDAGYMAATSPSADQQVFSSKAGRTIYVSRARRHSWIGAWIGRIAAQLGGLLALLLAE